VRVEYGMSAARLDPCDATLLDANDDAAAALLFLLFRGRVRQDVFMFDGDDASGVARRPRRVCART